MLIEHKSHPDEYTPIQIGSYIFSGFQKQIANKEPLSLIIPILLYHGEERWEYKTVSDFFTEIDSEWKQFIPDFTYILNDLGKLTDEEISRVENKFLAATFLALKYSQQKEWLNENAIYLFTLGAQAPDGLKKSLIIYIGSRSKLSENALNSLPEPIKQDVMNTLEIYFERGVEKGIKEGMKQGIEKGIEL